MVWWLTIIVMVGAAPVKNVGVAADWAKTLAAMNVWSDIEPWRLAVVLQVSKDKAVVGLRPHATLPGELKSRPSRVRSHSVSCSGRAPP